MRLIRLSPHFFPTIADVHNYFLDPQSIFRNRGPLALFCFPEGHVAEDGLHPGETVLFSYEGIVVYVAIAWSGRMNWNGQNSNQVPHCFQVNLASLRRGNFTVQQLATELGVPILASMGWPILPDGVQAEWAVNTLCGGP